MIRWKVFLPVLATVILVGWFATYRVDAWLKNAIEDSVSSITNTKTEVRQLRLSFRETSLVIGGFAIASSKDPFKNTVELADIVIDFQGLALLEKRFVIDEFSVRGIAWGTERKTSGFLPPRPKKKEEPSWLSEQVDVAFGHLKKEFQELPVAKLADFRVPTNPQEILNAVDLQSEEAFKASVVQFQESRTEWKSKISDLRDLSEYRRFGNEAQNLTRNMPKDPKQILNRVEEGKKILEFFKNEKEKAEALIQDVKKEGDELQSTYSNAVAAIRADYERARDLVSLDQLNIDNLSRLLFGSHWIDQAERVLYYHAVLRSKLDAIRTEDESVEVRQRASGRDIIFIVPKKKPGFVLAKSEFTVTGLERAQDDQRISQTYELSLKDINSAPKLYGRPTEVSALGRFRSAPIGKASVDLFWDYTQKESVDRYSAKVEQIEAKNWPVGIPRIFPLKLAGGSANSSSELEFLGSDMKWTNRINFSGVSWDFREVPKMGFVVPVLADTLESVKNFYLEIELIRQEVGGLAFKVRSDLDSKLRAAIMGVIDEKLKEFQAKLKAEIEAQVRRYRAEAEKQLAMYQKEIVGQVQERLDFAKKYEKEAQKQINQLQEKAKSAATDAVKGKAKDKLGDLKKDLPKIKNPF